MGGGGGGGGGGSGASASPEDVEMFIAENSLDDRAADAMRTCKPETAGAVIERGTVANARNPSSAVLGRIRDASNPAGQHPMMGKGGGMGGWGPDPRGGMAGGGGGFSGAMMGGGGAMASPLSAMSKFAVLQFIQENGIDERATEALMSATPAVQEQVLNRGSVRECRNPSSACLGRIKDAAASGVSAMFGVGGGKGAAGASPEVRAFIIANSLDDIAAQQLMNCTQDVQAAVFARGGLSECRNPSSALLGRIKDAKAGKGGSGPGLGDLGARSSPY